MRTLEIRAKEVENFHRTVLSHLDIADCREGVLLDNFLTYTKDGNNAMAIFEVAETANSSGYRVYIADEPEFQDLANKWQAFADRYDEEYEEE